MDLLAKAFALHQAGNLAEAALLYEEVLRERPLEPVALNNLGALRLQSGAFDAAVDTLSTLIALRPHDPIGHSNLGRALLQVRRPAEAEGHLRRAVALAPTLAQAHNHLGIALAQLGHNQAAVDSLRHALELQPNLVDAAANLGEILNDAGDGEGAAAAYGSWLRLDPGNLKARVGLALSSAMRGDLYEATRTLEQLTESHPQDAAAWQVLGLTHLWNGRLLPAETAARRALSLNAQMSEATFLVAASLLGRGEFGAGWREFERRPEGVFGQSLRFPDIAQWNGETIPGSLLLYGEQGLGDVVQFSRFLPRVKERTGDVVLLLDEHWTSLKPLLESSPGVGSIFTDVAELTNVRIAARASILSLPYLFGADPRAAATATRYLSAPPARVAEWKRKIAGSRSPRVGVAWSAFARTRLGFMTKHKSVPFGLFSQLLATPDITFFSLQKGPAAEAAREAIAAGLILDPTADLHDFGDTAALIENMDLIITTDTSVAHVAGALGKPTWMVDRYNTCWRWRLSSTDTPWYSTLRIFRQPKMLDWGSVIERVAAPLAEWANQSRVGHASAEADLHHPTCVGGAAE